MSDTKVNAELEYWQSRKDIEGTLGNSHYEKIMLSVAGKEKSFFDQKIMADFGCGPRGSLEWADNASERYCIDVLVEEYRSMGIDDHYAKYIESSEEIIPLPDESVDFIISLNAIDHAEKWEDMMRECIRILKPGCLFAMSINLDEPPSPAEPNTLTEAEILNVLDGHVEVQRKAISNRSKGSDKYLYLYEWADTGVSPPPYNGSWGIMWISGVKI